jgi:hypothetical protein
MDRTLCQVEVDCVTGTEITAVRRPSARAHRRWWCLQSLARASSETSSRNISTMALVIETVTGILMST